MAIGSEIKPYPLRLGNISKAFAVNNMKNTGLNNYACNFSVDYIINNSNIINIHHHLMKKEK